MGTVETSKNKLMRAILDQVLEDGYKNASTKKIAQRAGMNEASIFRLFGNKRDLFLDAVYHRTISTKDIDMNIVMAQETFEKRTANLLERCLRIYCRQMAIYRIFMLSTMDDMDIEHQKMVYSRVQKIIDLFASFLKSEYEKGWIRKINFSTFSEMLFSKILLTALSITSCESTHMEKVIHSFVQRHAEYICRQLLIKEPHSSN